MVSPISSGNVESTVIKVFAGTFTLKPPDALWIALVAFCCSSGKSGDAACAVIPLQLNRSISIRIKESRRLFCIFSPPSCMIYQVNENPSEIAGEASVGSISLIMM